MWFADDGELLVARRGRPAVRASRQVFELLAACDGARDVDELARVLAARGALGDVTGATATRVVRALVNLAREAALLDDGPGDVLDEAVGFGHPEVHRRMLADAPRTDAFRRALEAVVRPGDVVLDVGAGSGVLSAFAVQAGAGAVHAVEWACPGALREVVRGNGLDERVHVHVGDARALDLPRARVIVSEWLGVLLFGDVMWAAVASVRDRCLEPGGVMVPAAASLLLAPIEDAALRADGPAWWDTPRWGLDLTALGAREACAPRRRLALVSPDGLLARPEVLHDMDCLRAGPDAGLGSFQASYVVERDATLDAFVGWFVADLAPGVRLDTGPAAPATHWQQEVLPTRPHALRRGQRLDVTLTLGAARPGEMACELDVRLDGAPLHHARYV